jgi:hypothetical protein
MMVTSMVDLAVDLSALRHNYRQLRRLCAAGVKLMAVVKADAYGMASCPRPGPWPRRARIIWAWGHWRKDWYCGRRA